MTSLSEKTINNALTRSNSAEIAGFAMPSTSKYEALTLGASGSKYTAPANGYFVIDKSGSSQQNLIMRTKKINISYMMVNNQDAARLFIPVLKGDEMSVEYSASGTTWVFNFVYAEGEA